MNREDLLFKMFPPSFRQRYGHEMWRVYQEAYQDILQEKGRFAAFQYAFSSGFDFLKVALHEQLTEVQMLKSRPHVLLSLLALAGVTVFSSVQYGLWNVQAGQFNEGPLAYFNARDEKKDVTSEVKYADLKAAIMQQYPDAEVRILERNVNFGALRGEARLLSVVALVPSLDALVDPQPAYRAPTAWNEYAKKQLNSAAGKAFAHKTRAISTEMNFSQFDIRSFCVTSHFKTFKLPAQDPRRNGWQEDFGKTYLQGAMFQKGPQHTQPQGVFFLQGEVPLSAVANVEGEPLNVFNNCEVGAPTSRDDL
ncbi:hypothetical protein [Deinococcus misasensis]|uniref:hypothetical protein n=1 Tax=Deinococcus misasensis TaxID=392413 RepID=UPI00054F8987|nr:hypothetical protein [Deinococcus misasensis]